MRAVSISPETKELLRGRIVAGAAVDLWYFAFIRAERAFLNELLELAERHQNEAFFMSVADFLARERTKFIARQAAHEETEHRRAKRAKADAKPKPKTRPSKPLEPADVFHEPANPVKCSPNHNPTGQSFEDFLCERGIYINPNYRSRLHFVRGGAPGLGKRA